MNKPAEKAALVPQLRFPEFRGAEHWRVKKLGNICEILNNQRRPITGSERKSGLIPYYGASGIVDYVREFIFDERLLLLGEDGAKWNAFEKTAFIIEGKSWVNNHAHVLRPFAICDSLLENYLTMSDLCAFVTGAAPPKLTLGKLKGIPIPVPVSRIEQQKIADCLSSLDELIAAQVRKVDAFKTHKTGLTQRLFPLEVETQPRLRFPEFLGTEKWTFRPFGAFVKKSFYGTSSSTSDSGRYPVLRMGNMQDGKLIHANLAYLNLDPESFEKFRLQRGDILLNRTNSLALVGKISIFDSDIESLTASYIVTYRVDKLRIDPAFCNFMLNTPHYQADINALARPSVSQANINPKTFRNELVVSVPALAEQQRIADCLISLDSLITAAAQELQTLKTHKKGLMQQLFPATEAVTA